MKDGAVILIAEDDAGHFVLVKKNLWRSCVHNDILHFKDGQEVLDFLFRRSSSPSMSPDTAYLLLLDIRMPKVDGIEVLRQIKADKYLRKMPVIMLTTINDPREVALCHELGCSFYVVKPANYNDFMSCVEQLGAFLSLPSVEVPDISFDKETQSCKTGNTEV